jgi:hypothetical protein
MIWIVCGTVLWMALVVVMCLFLRVARSKDIGEGGSLANDNGILTQLGHRGRRSLIKRDARSTREGGKVA